MVYSSYSNKAQWKIQGKQKKFIFRRLARKELMTGFILCYNGKETELQPKPGKLAAVSFG